MSPSLDLYQARAKTPIERKTTQGVKLLGSDQEIHILQRKLWKAMSGKYAAW